MSTIELNNLKYNVIEELMSIDNKELLSKIGKYIKQVKEASVENGKEQFKQQLKNDLREALHEMHEMDAGKAKAYTMDELYAELEDAK